MSSKIKILPQLPQYRKNPDETIEIRLRQLLPAATAAQIPVRIEFHSFPKKYRNCRPAAKVKVK